MLNVTFAIVSCAVIACAVSRVPQGNVVVVERILTARVDEDTSVQVIRNTIVEHHPVEVVRRTEHGATVRGGEQRTDVLLVLVSQREQGWRPAIAWTHTESRTLHAGEDYAGWNRPTVMDVAQRGHCILLLHVRESTPRLAILERGDQSDSTWKVLRSAELPMSAPPHADHESQGLAGRIVQIGKDDYVHFIRADSSNDVFHINEEGISPEADPAIVRAVVEAPDEQTPATTRPE